MLIVGQRAPDFVLSTAQGVATRFYGIAGGRPLLLVFAEEPEAAALAAMSEVLGRARGLEGIALLLVRPGAPGVEPAPAVASIPMDRLYDPEREVHTRYGIEPGQGVTALLLDPSLRLLTTLHGALDRERGVEVAQVLDATLPPIAPLEIVAQAPVLLLANALDPGLCSELMALFDANGGVPTGVETSSAGRRRLRMDQDQKRRRDHTVNDPELVRLLVAAVGRRVMSEVEKAFAFSATRFEGFKIARYDAEELGYFRAHRDNLSPATRHRRFALTLNLNAGYEGGQLRFPEYGPHLYRPPAGGALIFSGSLLHEVLPVTQGQRYVLLSFLFGEGDRTTG